MVGVDCAIIMNPKVWEASGHVGGFNDLMVACKARGCNRLFRADKVISVGLYPPQYFGPGTLQKLQSNGYADAPSRLATVLEGRQPPIITMESDGVDEAIRMAQDHIRSYAKRHNLGGLKSFELVVPQERRGNVLLGRDAQGVEYACEFKTLVNMTYPEERCPACGGELTPPRAFGLMFDTHTGAVKDDSNKVYLRPETAQGIFANFQNVLDTSRVRIPFGIAQIGKAFRNEITPRNYTFRSREFEQMEIEFFCKPDELCREGEVKALEWYAFWRDVRINWYKSLGIASAKLRPREQGGDELAHYSKACTDIEYLFPFSDEFQELEGVAHRGCFDLSQHGKHAKGKEDAFAVFDDETKQRYVPHVIEPSAGVDRFTLAAITEAYTRDESRASPEFLTFHPRLAPIKAAVFPLVAKDGLPEIAEPIFREIKKHYPCQYDAKQSIGKRYARMDEAGTPFCFTIDGQTKEDGTLTVRNRDDASQERIDKSRCLEYLREKLRL
jgi:glycyl-tRNA synthetase